MKYFIIAVIIFSLGATGLLIWMPGDKQLERRRAAMQRCVDFLVGPPKLLKNAPKRETRYEVRFEDEFFCPTRPYTVLEVLQRAESVLNTREKPLNIVFSTTPEGIIVTSMLGKENDSKNRWLPAIGGSETTDKPLDKIVLEGPSYIRFYYK